MLKALLLALVTVAAYAPVYTAPFLYEDETTLQAQTLRPMALADLPGRYVSQLTISFDGWRGDGSTPFHQTNLVLHLLNGLLVYALARRLGLGDGAWLASALFLLHPIQTQAVSYISGRPDLVMTAAILATLLLVASIRVWDLEEFGAVFLAGLVCLATKEAAVVVVGLIALVAWRQDVDWLAWGIVVVPLVALVAVGFPRVQAINLKGSADPIRYMASQLTAVWAYLGLTVWPHGFSIEHDWFRAPLLVHLAAQSATILAVGWAWVHRQSHAAVAFGVAWVLIAVAPRLVVQLPDPIQEHQFYLAFVGVCLGLAALCPGAHWRTA